MTSYWHVKTKCFHQCLVYRFLALDKLFEVFGSRSSNSWLWISSKKLIKCFFTSVLEAIWRPVLARCWSFLFYHRLPQIPWLQIVLSKPLASNLSWLTKGHLLQVIGEILTPCWTFCLKLLHRTPVIDVDILSSNIHPDSWSKSASGLWRCLVNQGNAVLPLIFVLVMTLSHWTY